MMPINVFLPCSGLEHVARGFETFTRECFETLRPMRELNVTLFKGSGPRRDGEKIVPNLRRRSLPARIIDKATRRGCCEIEQTTFFLGMIPYLLTQKPDVIMVSDYDLAALIWRWRKRSGQKFRLLFSNGGPTDQPLGLFDLVHHPSPLYREKAIEAGETGERNISLPYGVKIAPALTPCTAEEKAALRARLGLPIEREIVISVGRVAFAHKRMDYLIRELAALPAPRPFLLMAGHQDQEAALVRQLADGLLGAENYAIRTAAKEEMPDYYRAADKFALASLKEGFGLAYVEAMSFGLPCFAHDSAVTRDIFQDREHLGNFETPGVLAGLLRQGDGKPQPASAAEERHAYAYRRFSWDVLGGQYLALIQKCAAL